MFVTLGTFRLNLLVFRPFQDLNLFMANVQGTLMTILHPQRISPSADVQVTTVRMYGKATHMCSFEMEQANHAERKLSDALKTSHRNKNVSKLTFENSFFFALFSLGNQSISRS